MIKAGFLPMMKVSWATSPVALAVAQNFLPEHAWAPFFNLIGFFIGTYINTYTKKRRLEMAKVCIAIFFPSFVSLCVVGFSIIAILLTLLQAAGDVG
jgi:hypothetical protein